MQTKFIGLLAALVSATIFNTAPATAGCGCEKPPPLPAAVRPHATYSGAQVALFHPALVEGGSYEARFAPSSGGQIIGAAGVASVARDLADGLDRAQLTVSLPTLPPGPAAIEIVSVDDGSVVSAISDDHFTVVPDPIGMPDCYGEHVHQGVRAAVGRDGLLYLALDLSDLQRPTIFEAQAMGLPLRFGNEDVVFYNTQGVLMQALVDQQIEPVPGMFVLPARNPDTNSDTLHYSRHEFASYFLSHDERAAHAVDEINPDWHLDGTRHIDHNHLILSIDAVFADGSAPAPGATASFDLRLDTHSLFRNGLVGHAAMTVRDDAMTDSYDPQTRAFASNGDIYSNGRVSLLGRAIVAGDVSGAEVITKQKAQILGDTFLVTDPLSFMNVARPAGLEDLGDITISPGESLTIEGPGSFQAGDLLLYSGGRLEIDNADGPVTLYVSGVIEMWSSSLVETASEDPEQFAIYSTTGEAISIWANGGGFYGVIYAPYSQLELSSGEFFGAFVAAEVIARGNSQVHYAETLRSSIAGGSISTDAAPVDELADGFEAVESAFDPSVEDVESSTSSTPRASKGSRRR